MGRGPGPAGGFAPRPPVGFAGERPEERPARRAAPPPLKILFEDDAIIVVEKAADMALSVPPGRERLPGTRTLQDQVLDHVRAGGGRKSGAWGVHELDREASGLVVFAKSPAAAESIRSAFTAKKCDAVYLAVVEGEMASLDEGVGSPGRVAKSSEPSSESNPAAGPENQADDAGSGAGEPVGAGGEAGRGARTRPVTGTVRSFIKKAGSRIESIPPDEFSGDRSGGRRAEAPRMAITHYRVVAGGRGRTLLRLRVKSPRMHQARVHMRDLGRVVLGDGMYGARDTRGRVMLHLAELSLPHPTTHEMLRLTSSAPASFWEAIGSRAPEDVATARGSEPGATGAGSTAPAEQGWEHVAEWYDALVAGKRNDLQDRVVTPGVLRLLEPRRGERVLDVACGPGELCRRLASMGVEAVGVDASEAMIAAARAPGLEEGEAGQVEVPGPAARFAVCDARSLGTLAEDPGVGAMASGGFDAATCVLALMNIDPLAEVLGGVASLLKPGGRFVAVVLHPAFRSPGLASWGWAEESVSGMGRGEIVRRQYRRVDAYLGEQAREVTMNPGAVARGEAPVVTITHHRPIGAYLSALGSAGLLVDRVEEWASQRRSQPGPRAMEEDRARREFPMFLAIRGVRR